VFVDLIIAKADEFGGPNGHLYVLCSLVQGSFGRFKSSQQGPSGFSSGPVRDAEILEEEDRKLLEDLGGLQDCRRSPRAPATYVILVIFFSRSRTALLLMIVRVMNL
jgi:hypothetical protein